MLRCLMKGGILFALAGAVVGLVNGDGPAYGAAVWAPAGLVVGALNYWNHRRSARYRSEVETPGPTLKRDELAPPSASRPYRRYHALPAMPILSVASTILLLAGALWLWLDSENAEPGLAWVCAGLAATFALFPLYTLWNYTELGPDGIVVRTNFKFRTVIWERLSEVGWLRDGWADWVILTTIDGQQSKAIGVGVTTTGVGRKRTMRFLADVENAWAGSLRHPPKAALI